MISENFSILFLRERSMPLLSGSVPYLPPDRMLTKIVQYNL
jgi:hypothetical protein